jgi:hypothetical protein
MKTVEILEALTNYAKVYIKGAAQSVIRNNHMNQLGENDAITQEQIEAVVVDFINFIGVSNGVDYALYTRDIKQVEVKL